LDTGSAPSKPSTLEQQERNTGGATANQVDYSPPKLGGDALA
jgi:hypothetical protein